MAQLFVLLLALAGNLPAAGQGPQTAQAFAVQTWQTEHGLPQNSITALFQSREGYLWLGTFNGLVRFDGLDFKVFNSANTPGLLNSRITSLFEETDGTIWIGHETGGLTRLRAGLFEKVELGSGWRGGAVAALSADEHGDLWVLGERSTLLRLRDGLSIPLGPSRRAEAAGIPSLVRDSLGRLWLMRDGFVIPVQPTSHAAVRFGSADPEAFFSKVCGAPDGGLWVVGEGRLREWDGQRWIRDFGPCPWQNAFVTAMLETSSGRILVGTLDQGLFVFDPSGQHFRLGWTNGLPQDWVRCLAEDREGNIWVGTSGGLSVLRTRKVTMCSPPDAWQGKPVLGTIHSQDGGIWAGTEGAGLYRLKEGLWTRFGPEKGLANQFIWSVFEDHAGRLWAGSWGNGLYLKQEEYFKKSAELAALQEAVTTLAESPAGTLWIGTGAGLMSFADGRLESFADLGGPAASDVRALWCAGDGTVWIGTMGMGLGKLRGRNLKAFTTQDGLGSQFVLSLHLDEERTLWIGTLDNGIGRFKDGRFGTVSARQGLPNNTIGQIAEDQKGNLWLGTQGGLCCVSKQELQKCADGRALSVSCIVYGKEEGLTTLACSGGFQPNHSRSRDGRLWFSTAKGLAVVDPARVRRNSMPPPVLLEDVLIEGMVAKVDLDPRPRSLRPGPASPEAGLPSLVVPPGQSRIEIRFTGISFTAPERIRFKYTLEGLESAWREAEGRRSVNYGYLPPGEYLFRVIACNSDGLWNGAGASLAIRILPHFWQTWWLKSFAGLSGIATIGGGVFIGSRRRMRRKLQRSTQEHALERERARIARDIHDDLGASLTRITLLSQTVHSELEDQPQVAAEVDQIYTTARELTRAMDEIVWATNPRHDTLESLITYFGRYAQGFLSAAGIRCRLDEPMHVPAWTLTSEVRHNLFLAFKEALNNAVKHAGASEVRISLELKSNGFSLMVADNGRGFDGHPLQDHRNPAAAGPRSAPGNGLLNMQKHLDEAGGRCEWDTAPGEGTRVKLEVTVKT